MNNRTFNVIASILFLILFVATAMNIGDARLQRARIRTVNNGVSNVAVSVNALAGQMEFWRREGLIHRHVPPTNAPTQKKD